MVYLRSFCLQPSVAVACVLVAAPACSDSHRHPLSAPSPQQQEAEQGTPQGGQEGDPGQEPAGEQTSGGDPQSGGEPQGGDAPPVGLYYGRNVEATPSVVAAMRAIAGRDASRNDTVFMKVGDSITVNSNAFCCFAASAGKPISLGAYGDLAATVRFFDSTSLPNGYTAWSRPSESAAVGVWSNWPLEATGGAGSLSPLWTEVAAVNPRFAVVMLGTNDLVGADEEWQLGPRILRAYAHNLTRIVETLSAGGIITLLTYIPPAYTTQERERLAPAFNAIVRGVATAAQLPTIDFYSDMAALGVAGTVGDGEHPTVYPTSGCVFTPEGLAYGYNLRNLRTLQALHSVREAMRSGSAVLPEAPAVQGRGTATSPLVITQLPFALKLPLVGPGATGSLDDYTGCGGQAQQTGDEWVFSLRLQGTTALRIIVVPTTGECEAGAGPLRLCEGTEDVSVELFGDTLAPARCLRADATMIEKTLAAGDYHIVVDSHAGVQSPYAILTIDDCLAGDPACN
jgi:hypothetical protein